MAVNLFIRKTFNANALKRAINQNLDTKVRALKKDKQLANTIARAWADRVTRFVPRSLEDGHHLQDYYVSDGRVVWRRPARRDDKKLGITAGEELAYRLYEGPIKGKFQSRYSEHTPMPHWDQFVQPGTDEWYAFAEDVTPTIIDWMSNSNG